jgi:hypothetical protein
MTEHLVGMLIKIKKIFTSKLIKNPLEENEGRTNKLYEVNSHPEKTKAV